MPRFQGFRVPRSQGSKVPGFQGSRVPGFQGSRVPGFRGSKVSGFEGSRVPRYQGPTVSGFQGFQGSKGSKGQHMVCSPGMPLNQGKHNSAKREIKKIELKTKTCQKMIKLGYSTVRAVRNAIPCTALTWGKNPDTLGAAKASAIM